MKTPSSFFRVGFVDKDGGVMVEVTLTDYRNSLDSQRTLLEVQEIEEIDDNQM